MVTFSMFRALLTQQTRNVQPRWIQHTCSMLGHRRYNHDHCRHKAKKEKWAQFQRKSLSRDQTLWIFRPGRYMLHVCLSALSIDVAFYCYYVFQTLGPPNLQTRPTLYMCSTYSTQTKMAMYRELRKR